VIAKLRTWSAEDGRSGTLLYLWCPACDDAHAVQIDGEPRWTWDGNLDAPTISPSVLVGGVQWNPGDHFYKPHHHVEPGGRITCHSYVKQGRWEFLGDCTHDLAGQTVPVPPLPDWLTT